MIEILAPAGNFDKLKTAFYYGADACYLAGKSFGLRAFSDNFSLDELKEAVKYAHSLKKKVYVTVNIIAHNPDFNGLLDYLKYLEKIKVDGIIVADIGIIKLARDNTKLNVHVSTQANITNKYTAKFFADLGVTRIVLARELSIGEIREIRDFLPKHVELEAFVHGAMCISYSGRCLLSNFMTGRDGNRGGCVQACRWNYAISEKSREEDKYEIQEDSRGTYILNSKDLNMLPHLQELIDAGVTSFKIEGRMKSVYYVGTVVNAYRRMLDSILARKKAPKELYLELGKTSHRRFTTAFYFGSKDSEHTETSTPIQTHEFMAYVLEDAQNGSVLIEQRNKFVVGDVLEILSPTNMFNKEIVVKEMCNEQGEKIIEANHVQQKIRLKTKAKLKAGDILRKKI